MKKYIFIFLTTLLTLSFSVNDVMAQRMRHSSSGRGGGGGRSINGGASRSANRPQTREYNKPQRTKPSTANRVKPSTGNRAKPNVGNRDKPSNRDRNRTGNTKIQGGDKKKGRSGNKVNIDNRRTNVNVNVNRNVHINNSHHNRYYNGHRGYSPYRYHPYRPYYYGPRWHPFGFFVATVATTAIIISINSQPYYYDYGIYYVQVSGGYNVVPPPVNIVVVEIPDDKVAVPLNDVTYSVVANIPEGAEEQEIDGQKYVVFNDTYFQPITQNGKDVYQVVAMESND
jgi:hypothetical protein